MTVKLIKVSQSAWDVQAGKNIIGRCNLNYKGLYQIKMPNGNTINAGTQKALKLIVAKEMVSNG
jgi:hypothetical protein